jgi:hypothetical protein
MPESKAALNDGRGNATQFAVVGAQGRHTTMEQRMKSSIVRALLVTSGLVVTGTSGFAQSYPAARYYDNRVATPAYSYYGEQRGTAYGQGGSAGTHPTGANVGPGRAEMDHAN